MNKSSQRQTTGDNATSLQSGRDIHYHEGMDYLQVKEVAMDVFKSNFYDLGEKVEKIIIERAEGFISKYLDKLKEEAPENLSNTEDPDIRFALYEAQKNHARRGDAEISDIMVDMLVSRTKVEDESLMKLVTNEALEIIPKLTIKQIDIMTIIFLMRYVNIGEIFKLDRLFKLINIFANDIPEDQFFYQHLQYAGCASISSMGSVTFERIINAHYPAGKKELSEILSEASPNLSKIVQKWEATLLKNSSLTSVGIAIALSNLKRRTDFDWDLRIWIKD